MKKTLTKQVLTRLPFLLAVFFVFGLAGCAPTSGSAENPAAPQSAYIQNKGSDTLVNLALAWAEAYQFVNPEVRISVTGGGSGTGLAALENGTTDIANASRAMKAVEADAIRAKGLEPLEYIIARDAIAIIVNPSNPVSQLTMQQLSDIYSGKINNWQELGGEDRPIVRLSRETNSGTHVYFLEEVLRLGSPDNKIYFSPDTLLLPSSEVIVAEVRHNPNAIGYDGLGYVTADMKVIAIAVQAGGDYVLPSAETVNAGAYPISRDLYMYTAGQPQGALADYLAWIFSAEAQDIVTSLGFVPVTVSP